MEMKPVANDKPGPGVESARPKMIARKSTSVPRKREPKCDADEEEDLCPMQIYEVVGKVKDHPNGAAALAQGKNPQKKPGDSNESIVVGDEIFKRISDGKESSKRSKEKEMLDLVDTIKTESPREKNFTPHVHKKQLLKSPAPASTAKKTIPWEGNSQNVKSSSPGIAKDKKFVVPANKDCTNTMPRGKGKTLMTSPFSIPKKSIGKAVVAEVTNKGAAKGKVDVGVEANERDIGTNNGVSLTKEKTGDMGKEDKKNVPDKVPDDILMEVPGDNIVEDGAIDLVNEVQEVVVSSGSSWDIEDQPKFKTWDTTGNIDEDDDEEDDDEDDNDEDILIGEVRIDRDGSVEFAKKFKKGSNSRGGTIIEIRQDRTSTMTREEQKRMNERLERENMERMARERRARMEREKMERERMEKEKMEKEKREKEKMEREKREKEKLEREKIEREKLEREKRARMEREMMARMEREQMQREKMEREKMEKEKMEKQKIEKEKMEREKMQREKMEREKLEREKMEREKMEREKLEREKMEREKMEREKMQREKLEREKMERERMQREKLEREKLEREKMEREKMQREKLEREKMERERMQREKLEREKLEREKMEREKMQREKLEREKIEREKMEREKMEREKMQREKLEREKMQREKLEREKIEREKMEREKMEREKMQREKMEREKMEREKMQREKLEREKMEREKMQREKLEREKMEREKMQREKMEREKLEREKMEREKMQREKMEREKMEREKMQREKMEREKMERERMQREKLEREKMEREKMQREKLEREKIEREKREREEIARMERERIEKEKMERERMEREKRARMERDMMARMEREKMEREKMQREKLEREKIEKEKIEREKIEKEKMERERMEKEKREREKMQREKMEREKMQREKLEREKREKEKLEREKMEKEKIEREKIARMEREKMERERMERERMEKEMREREKIARMERERMEKEKREREKREKEKLEREKMEKEKIEREKIARMEREMMARMEREKMERERMERERMEKEMREREKIARMEREKMEREKREREKMEKEKIEREKIARMEREKIAKMEREKIARMEREKIARMEREKIARMEREKMERERMEREKMEREKMEREKIARMERERMERERMEREKMARMEKEKGAIQDEEIGSVAGEVPIEDGKKRKRVRKGSGTKNSNAKKRKVEKSKDKESEDEADKGKSNADKSTKKDPVKPGSSICDQSTLEETIDRVASGHLSLPFLENLRGEIKSLSRGDLEELIVQKLCEVITERSTVGHLRKRAEALEKNQERWKEKVQSLTKQIREMDMVMKNYLSEVRRHHTEKGFQMVAPLRVTRSVGLQVSFTTTPSRSARIMPKCFGDTHHGWEKAGNHVHGSVQVSEAPNQTIPILPSTSSEMPFAIDSKNKFSTKSGLTITLQPASSSTEAHSTTKSVHIQQPKLSILPVTEYLNTSLIDLTGDDERSKEDMAPDTSQQTVTVGPAGQVKVVNHIQRAQSPVGSVTLLISNSKKSPCRSSASASGSSRSDSPNRQLVMSGSQSIQKHTLPAIPTLIYKTNALIQPGSQVATSQALASAAKLLKHPAPLPQPPSNQIHKPNWKLLPPRPALQITKGEKGIVLSWNMKLGPEYEKIVSYQLFAYQEGDSPPSSSMWKRVGDIKALRLPMACTLTQFLTGHRYFFAVRAVDTHSRVGPFSFPSSITLVG